MCVGQHYPQANTNNVNKTQALLQKFEINFVNHENMFKIKTGYIQTDEGGVNTQYKSNKNKRWDIKPNNKYN